MDEETNVYVCIYILYIIYIYIYKCKYIYIYIYMMYVYIYIYVLRLNPFDLRIKRKGWCHSCGFTCQQRVLKTVPGPGFIRSEDKVN